MKRKNKSDAYDMTTARQSKIRKIEGKKLIVVLEDCSLESDKVGNNYVILSSDKHRQFLLKQHKDPMKYRPDILHQCLLTLLDSPLNRAGLLQVYFRTNKNVLVEVNPQCRIPRTFDRFCGLMVQLLAKRKVRASDSSAVLLKVIKNPIMMHMPVGIKTYLTSFNTDLLIRPRELVKNDENEPILVVVGGIATGKVTTDYTEKDIKISSYPLSAALTCAKLTHEIEEVWGIF
uniref:18S rRNA (pseudouridine-N1)-methyltransferase n=1 Tax=Acrobeloides nanus TaxID=290746 RepID=A0A914DG20_9BILA